MLLLKDLLLPLDGCMDEVGIPAMDICWRVMFHCGEQICDLSGEFVIMELYVPSR